MTKKQIFERIQKIINITEEGLVKEELGILKRDLLLDIMKTEKLDEDTKLEALMCRIMTDIHTPLSKSVDAKKQVVWHFDDKYIYSNGHVIVVTHKKIGEWPEQKAPDIVLKMLEEDYTTSDTASFPCITQEEILDKILSLNGKTDGSNIVHRFLAGPAINAAYYLWAIQLTKTKIMHSKKPASDTKWWKNAMRFEGNGFTVYVMPRTTVSNDVWCISTF